MNIYTRRDMVLWKSVGDLLGPATWAGFRKGPFSGGHLLVLTAEEGVFEVELVLYFPSSRGRRLASGTACLSVCLGLTVSVHGSVEPCDPSSMLKLR